MAYRPEMRVRYGAIARAAGMACAHTTMVQQHLKAQSQAQQPGPVVSSMAQVAQPQGSAFKPSVNPAG